MFMGNANFLNSPHGESLIKDFNIRREKAKQRTDKNQNGALVKLSQLSAGGSLIADPNLLNNVNKLRECWLKCQNTADFDDQTLCALTIPEGKLIVSHAEKNHKQVISRKNKGLEICPPFEDAKNDELSFQEKAAAQELLTMNKKTLVHDKEEHVKANIPISPPASQLMESTQIFGTSYCESCL